MVKHYLNQIKGIYIYINSDFEIYDQILKFKPSENIFTEDIPEELQVFL